MVEKIWKCPRQTNGQICGWKNSWRRKVCECCGKQKPKKRASSRDVPDVPYEECLKLFGDACMFPGCEVRDTPERKLNRDHDHATGEIRGLLCFVHNFRAVRGISWERAQGVYDYLRRHEERMGRL